MDNAINSLIKSICVESLFGYIDYAIDASKLDAFDQSITLFYGENGSGKTTLLKLIYGCVASKSWGVRKQICGIKFKLFRLVTTYGLTVELSKEEADNRHYQFLIKDIKGDHIYQVDLTKDGEIKFYGAGDTESLSKKLESFGVDAVFINDRRRIRSTKQALVFKDGQSDRIYPALSYNTYVSAINNSSEDADIRRVARAVSDEFRREVLREGRSGQESSDAIYLELARNISTFDKKIPEQENLHYLLNNLSDLEKNLSGVLRYRAMAKPPIDEIRQILQSTPEFRKPDVVRVFIPYVESMVARTAALRRSVDKFSLLIDTLNEYFTRKVVRFDLDRGLRVTSHDGSRIQLRLLSSGEQHLFMLLASAFLCRGSKTLFLIDEPELSLNVYWQRRLPITLRDLVKLAGVDFILSTHSLEILTEFNNRICMIGK